MSWHIIIFIPDDRPLPSFLLVGSSSDYQEGLAAPAHRPVPEGEGHRVHPARCHGLQRRQPRAHGGETSSHPRHFIVALSRILLTHIVFSVLQGNIHIVIYSND